MYVLGNVLNNDDTYVEGDVNPITHSFVAVQTTH